MPATSLEPLLRKAVEDTTADDGWALLSHVGSVLQKTYPSFDARNYGFAKLSELARKQPAYLEVREGKGGKDGKISVLYVRLEQKRD